MQSLVDLMAKLASLQASVATCYRKKVGKCCLGVARPRFRSQADLTRPNHERLKFQDLFTCIF
jgi:hypothetical protein